MSTEQDNERVTQLKAAMLSPENLARISQFIKDTAEAMTSAVFTGDAAQISEQIGQYHFNKGMLSAYQNLLADHQEAMETLRNQPSN